MRIGLSSSLHRHIVKGSASIKRFASWNKTSQQRDLWLLQLIAWQRGGRLLAVVSQEEAAVKICATLVCGTDIEWCCSCSRCYPDFLDLHEELQVRSNAKVACLVCLPLAEML